MEIRITKKLLRSYRKLKREIPLLEQELEELRQGYNGFGNSVIMDYRTGEPRPQSVVGFDWERYGRRKCALDKKKAQVKAVEGWIQAIEDGQTRVVFRMYYIDGMSWEKIAVKIGYAGNPDYPRLCIRDKYLKEQGVK